MHVQPDAPPPATARATARAPSTRVSVRSKATDVFEQARNLPDWQQSYWQLSCGAFSGETHVVGLAGAQLFREVMNRAVDQLGQAPEGRLVLGIPVNTQGTGYWAGHALDSDSLLSLRSGGELVFRTPQASDMAFVTIDIDKLCQYAFRRDGIEIGERIQNLAYVSSLAPNAASRLRRFLELAMNHDLLDTDERGHAQLFDDLCEACLMALTPTAKPSNRVMGQRVHRYLVNRVLERVLSCPTEAPTVGALAAELRVSSRTLHHAFHNVLGVNVVTYMRTVRLHEARRALRGSAASPGRVREVAADCGFWHLGLFAQHYRELFGELPSQTGTSRLK